MKSRPGFFVTFKWAGSTVGGIRQDAAPTYKAVPISLSSDNERFYLKDLRLTCLFFSPSLLEMIPRQEKFRESRV